MRLNIIRQDTQENFELSSHPYGGFMLDASTVIPQPTNLDVTGFEYSGRDGGYQTSSRLQRRPFDISFMIREDRTTNLGLFELLRQAQRFFHSHYDDLTPRLYTIEVYSNDRNKSSFMLRNGTISVALGARTEKGETRASATVGFIFGDPYLYPIGETGVGISRLRLFPPGDNSEPLGRLWDENDGAVWDENDGKLWVTSSDLPGEAVSIEVVSSATVAVEATTAGQLISPEIINLTNGTRFRYNGTLLADDILTLDSRGNVLLNGQTPPYSWSGELTAVDGINTFILSAPGNSSGHVDLLIRGAF